MKKRWLSLALAILMVFALIPQAALPVLAEEEITLDQIEAEIPTDQVKENIPADGNEEELILEDGFPEDQIDEGMTVELEDLSLDLDPNGIVRNELPNAGSDGTLQANDGVPVCQQELERFRGRFRDAGMHGLFQDR